MTVELRLGDFPKAALRLLAFLVSSNTPMGSGGVASATAGLTATRISMPRHLASLLSANGYIIMNASPVVGGEILRHWGVTAQCRLMVLPCIVFLTLLDYTYTHELSSRFHVPAELTVGYVAEQGGG